VQSWKLVGKEMRKLSVLRVSSVRMGDRPKNLTRSMYFDMRIGVIRD
jgi:hypothetical protein